MTVTQISSSGSNTLNSKKPLSAAFEASARTAGLFLVGLYRSIGPAFLGGSCRFEPSCSHYAAEALNTHTFFKAVQLITFRLAKCRPGGPAGFDPVPGIGSKV
ncbi:MAG TPA: membrane protein insertion efficiency factor YidD [Bdellovibrionales bacterium]|nr:membrane protein insertion efficiency factor YidD [Bdellovibrionales bacterium]